MSKWFHKGYPIKPEPTELAKNVFLETCCIENIYAKFGRTLSKEENDVRKFILTQTPILGRIPSIDEIKKAFIQFPTKKVYTILNKLDQLDVIRLDDGRTAIAAAYPLFRL